MCLTELLTVKETAAILKTSRVQIRKMIQNGELSAIMVGREYRIPAKALDTYAQENCSFLGHI